MPGLVITESSIVKCTHQFPVAPKFTDTHVKVQGQPVVLVGRPYDMATCTAGQAKCNGGSWTQGATRVMASGVPVAIATGISVIAPPGTFTVGINQPHVTAT